MDLNVYEDDDDETLHRKLIAAKIARKRAEEDLKLLSNRIGLLKAEEQKVCLINFNHIHLKYGGYFSNETLIPYITHFTIGMEKDWGNKEESKRYFISQTKKSRDIAKETWETKTKGGRRTNEIGPK